MTETLELQLLTPREVADLLRLSRRSVYTLIEQGHLLAARLPGGQLRIRATDALELLDHEPREAD